MGMSGVGHPQRPKSDLSISCSTPTRGGIQLNPAQHFIAHYISNGCLVTFYYCHVLQKCMYLMQTV